MTKIYLASASPRRREILELMKLDFKVMCAEADEELPKSTPPESAGEILAARKANALKKELCEKGLFDSDTVIIAADTLVWCDGKRLGKPKDVSDAKNMLLTLSGKSHFVCTGTCIIKGERSMSTSEISTVYMRAFSETEADAYIATGEPLDKAGAYGIQGIGSVLIDRIDGDFFSVMGLSPKTVCKLMRAVGLPYFNIISKI